MNRTLCTIFLVILLGMSLSSFAQDFTVTIPSTDPYQKLCKPIKAGNSFQMQIKVKSNINDTLTISIDKGMSFSTFENWFTIDVNSFSIVKNQTVVFLLTLNIPANTNEFKYPFFPYFNVRKGSSNSPFQGGEFNVIVDNTPPMTPNVSISSKTYNSISINFNCTDARSIEYTQANGDAGVDGIKSYTLLLKDSNGNTVGQPFSDEAKNMSFYYTFGSLASYTEYSAFVTAVDVAGNSKTSPGLAAFTKVGAITGINATSITYCSATLSWTAVSGATSYRVSTSADGSNPITVNTPTLPISGLTAGTRYTYYLSAVGTEGEGPRVSASFTTLARPALLISGSSTLCAPDLYTFTASNIPAGYTVNWSYTSNLVYVSGQGTNKLVVQAIDYGTGNDTIQKAMMTSNDYGRAGLITATITGECGDFPYTKTIWVGKPGFTPVISGLTSMWCSQTALFVEQNNQSVTWSTYGPLTASGNYGYKSTVKATGSGVGWVYATASNLCGSFRGELMVEVSCGSYSVFPNPATSEVTISQKMERSISTSETRNKPIKSVRIFDKFGSTLYQKNYGSDTFESTVNISTLPIGIYIVKINEGSDEESHTIIKQ